VALDPTSPFSEKSVFTDCFSATHQIHYHGGQIAITAPMTNSVATVDTVSDKAVFHNWTEFKTNVNHINAVWRDGDTWWVNYHNQTLGSPSCIVQLTSDFTTPLKKINIGTQVHNVARVDNLLYICSSGENKLLVYDLDTDKVVKEADGFKWIRGLAITEDYILVGSSPVQKDRKRRYQDVSCVKQLDRETLRCLVTTWLPDQGPVYEIRVTSERDYAHNGIRFPGV
jgi:hypothetical protein